MNRPRSLGNIVNRVFDSSGPEGKVRGTPQQIIDKYLVLARDAQLSGDRVAAENFLQHAEHYTRMLSEAQRDLVREHEARREQHNGQNRRLEGREGGERYGPAEDADVADQPAARDPGGRRSDSPGERRRNGRDERGREAPTSPAETPMAAVDAADESETMLVETPESRRRWGDETPAGAPYDEPADAAPGAARPPEAGTGGDIPAVEDALESPAGDRRPRQPRARTGARRTPRKAKAGGGDQGSDGGPGSDSGSAAAAE